MENNNEKILDDPEMESMIEEDMSSFPEVKIVKGYLADEIEVETLPSADCFTNSDIYHYLERYFRFFGNNDMDVIYLYFLSKKRQEDIVDILKKSQPAISYDVTRIREQINFVINMTKFVDEFIAFISDANNGLNTYDREMLAVFFYSTSIIKTSRILGISNITCRSHINTIVSHLKLSGYDRMHDIFRYILSNLNNIKKFVARTKIVKK